MIHRYQRLEAIGSGGTGAVSAVRDLWYGGRAVALKMANDETLNGVLEKEYLFMRSCAHPVLPLVYDCGIDRETGRFFYTMEWCRGGTLSQWLETEQGEGEKLLLLARLLDCVSHLHRIGVTHGDLSPLNVMVKEASGHLEVKLLDVGLGTESGVSGVSGALEYLAPECLSGAGKTPGSDVFSLGLLCFRTLFDQHPFQDYPRSPVKKVLYPSGQGGIRRALREGLDAALSIEPVRRPANAGELLEMMPLVREALDWKTVLGERLERVSREIPVQAPLLEHLARFDFFVSHSHERGHGLHWVGGRGLGKTRAITEFELLGKRNGHEPVALQATGSDVRFSGLYSLLQVLFEDVVTGEERFDPSMPTVFQAAIRQELAKSDEAWSGAPFSLLTDTTALETEYLDALVRGVLWEAAQRSIWVVADNWESLDQGSCQFLRRLARAIARGQAPGLFLITSGVAALAEGENHDVICLAPWGEDSIAVLAEAFFPGYELSREMEREWVSRGGGVPGRLVKTIMEFSHHECIHFVASEVRLDPLKKEVVERLRQGRDWGELGRSHFSEKEWKVLTALQAVGCLVRPRELGQICEVEPSPLRAVVDGMMSRGILESSWVDGERCVGLSGAPSEAGKELHPQLDTQWHRNAARILENSPVPGSMAASLALRIRCHKGEPEELELLLSRLGEWVDKGRWADVAPLLELLMKTDSRLPELAQFQLLLLYGKALRGTGELERAEQVLERVLDSGHSEAEARALLCSVQVLRGQYSSAMEHLRVALGESSLSPEKRGELSYWMAHSALHLGRYEDAIKTEEDAQHYLRENRDGHREIRSRLLRTRGLAHLYQGQEEEARDYFREARRAAEGQLLELASVDSCLALMHFRTRHMDGALTVYKRALSYMEQAGARVKQGALLMNLGVVYQGMGAFMDARQQYQQALEIAELLEDDLGAFRVRNNLANVSVRLGCLDDAEAFIAEARASGLGDEQPYLETFNITLLGEIARERGDYEKAAAYLQEALERFDGMKNLHESIEVQLEQVMLDLRRGKIEQANQVAQTAVEKSREEGISHSLITALALAAEGERRIPTGDLEKAGTWVRESLELARQEEQYEQLWFVLLCASRIFRDQGSLEEARGVAIEGMDLLRGSTRQLPASAQPLFLSVQERGTALEEFRWVEALANLSLSPVEKSGGEPLVGSKLLEINKRLNTERNLERLLEFIMDSAVFLTGAERGFLILRGEEEEEGDLKFRVARNIDQENIAKGSLQISNSIAARVLESGEAVVTIDAMEDDRYREMLSVHQQKLRSVLCLPLRRSGRVMGVLYIDNRFQLDAFGLDEMDFMEAFADQAAIAIGNASLFEESQRARADLEESQIKVQELNRQLEEKLQRTSMALKESRTKVRRQQAQLENRHEYKNLVGSSDQLREVLYKIDRIRDVDVPVLISGESGTGKELVARAIHYNGARKQTEIVAVNCGAIPANLFESVLFGHVRGSFTGASQDKAGLFEVAHGGTLFLDELGEMPLDLQVKLLRVLQSGEFQRLGENRTRRVDVRVIAATNRDLAEEVKAKRFREDLFYRLNVISIALPPLRDRMDDLPLLVQHFIEANLEKGISKVERVSPEALQFLGQYAWPGNIRELDTIMKNASLFCVGDCLELTDFAHLPQLFEDAEGGRVRGSEGVPLGKPLAIIEKEAIIGTLESLGGNKKKTAEILGIDRRTLYNKLETYGVTVEKSARVRGK